MEKPIERLQRHRRALLRCRRCPKVNPPVVTGLAVTSPVYLLGQAPGPHEGRLGRPFAYTAGKKLFQWFASLGVSEESFRSQAYMAAVLRCFPGKSASGGDRVPGASEIKQCSAWIRAELEILKPELVIAVGRLAIEQVLDEKAPKLTEVVGPVHRGSFHGHSVDWVALPHPSGLNTWYKVEPGSKLLARALASLGKHSVFRHTFVDSGKTSPVGR